MNVARIRGILLSPKSEWSAIAAEEVEARDLWLKWVLPLSLIGPVAGLVGGLLFGGPLASLTGFRLGARYYLQAAVVAVVGSLLAVAVVSVLARVLAPRFGARCEGTTGLKLAAYSFTAAWLAGVFGLIPALAPLSLVGLYSLYLLYLGLRPLTAVPDDKAVPYAAALIVGGMVASLGLSWLLR